LSPTRELSSQILDSFRTYGRHRRHQRRPGDRRRAAGPPGQGLGARPRRARRHAGPADGSQSLRRLRLDRVEVFVLDEADRMLDMGFIRDIRTIIAKLPVKRQTLLFSATMPADIAELADQMLRTRPRWR
jgi:ATP-dependent RNA helicase RhlE